VLSHQPKSQFQTQHCVETDNIKTRQITGNTGGKIITIIIIAII
jgi:hypothetical protein